MSRLRNVVHQAWTHHTSACGLHRFKVRTESSSFRGSKLTAAEAAERRLCVGLDALASPTHLLISNSWKLRVPVDTYTMDPQIVGKGVREVPKPKPIAAFPKYVRGKPLVCCYSS